MSPFIVMVEACKTNTESERHGKFFVTGLLLDEVEMQGPMPTIANPSNYSLTTNPTTVVYIKLHII